MKNNDKRLIRLAKGSSRSLGKVKNQTLAWEKVCEMLGFVTRTPEKFKEFKALPQDDRNRLKNVAGWLLGGHCEGNRRSKDSIKFRDLLTFDLDDATEDQLFELENGSSDISDYEFFWHTTRSHSAEAPKLRIFVPLENPIPADQYDAAARIFASILDPTMDTVDPVSFRVSQLMYLPTASKNGEFKSGRNRGRVLDAAVLLRDFKGDWKDYTQLPFSELRGMQRPSAKKAENPLEKPGLIGAFCRAYDVEEAISEFLPDIYAPGDEHSNKPRYNYLLGSGANGVVVEDDGLFIYSHHGTDPCGDRLCNAWDMVRIHKFGEMDTEVRDDLPAGQHPSYKAMAALAQKDVRVREQLMQDRYDLAAMFEDAEESGYSEEEQEHAEIDEELEDLVGTPTSKKFDIQDALKPRKPRAPTKDWSKTLLEIDLQGKILPTVHNVAMIVRNDPRLFGCVALNEFTNQPVLRRSIKTKTPSVPNIICEDVENGDNWSDLHDYVVRTIIEAAGGAPMFGWGLKVSDRDLHAAIALAAEFNKFHPIKELWYRLPAWDGVKRLDTLFIDYLGCEDHPYFRETASLIVLASIARVFKPGHKFDTAPIISGAQGIRKSTFIKEIWGEGYVGEFSKHFTDDKQMVEAMLGKLGLELPELSSLRKSESDDAKHQMTIQIDRVRLSYDRRAKDFPRQSVFMGTTNSDTYLKDRTGNRRWWPIPTDRRQIDTDRLAANRDQLWAEALLRYEELRQDYPHDRLPLYLQKGQSRAKAQELQEAFREESQEETMGATISAWLETPRPLSVVQGTAAHDGLAIAADDEPLAVPTVVCLPQIYCECLHGDMSRYAGNSMLAQKIGAALREVPGWVQTGSRKPVGSWGRQRVYKRVDATHEEIEAGYRLLVSEDPEDDLI